jgi:hypothetical protein
MLPVSALASVGKIVIAQGDVFAVDANNEQHNLARRSDINEGDTLVTGTDGSLQIRFNDNAVLALSPNSRLRISEYHGRDANNDDEQVLMDLLAGGFRTITGSIGSSDRDAYQVRTPNASIGIRGTHYEALLDQANLLLGVYEGGIVVSNGNGSLNLGIGGEFLFGQVGPDTAPEGLLTPPARLNQSTVPSTGQSGQPQPEDEPESQLGEEESGIPLDIAFGADEPPPTIPQLSGEPDELSLAFVSELEDALDDFGEQAESFEPVTDVRLTSEQQLALADNPSRGFVVLTDGNGDAVHFVYRVDGTNGPVFINYDTETLTELDEGYVTPDRVYKGPETIAPQSLATFERENQTIEWGIWNASETDPAILMESSDKLDVGSKDTTPFYYVFAEPADLSSLVGSRNLTLCTNCLNISTSSGLALSSGSGNMDVNLDNLTVSSDLSISMVDGSSWNLYFSGNLEDSLLSTNDLFTPAVTELDRPRFDSSYTLGNESQQFTDLTGEFQGMFINSSDQGLEFVGGFGVSSNDANESISGVFLMSGSDTTSATTGQ